MEKASGITVSSSSTDFTMTLCLVMGKERPKVSASWKASVPMRLEFTWPVMATRGMESLRASAMAVRRFMAPGPLVAIQTAGRPVVLAIPWAMKPAACSWRTSTWRMELEASWLYRGRTEPPGIPATVVTPCRSSSFTIIWAPVASIIISS